MLVVGVGAEPELSVGFGSVGEHVVLHGERPHEGVPHEAAGKANDVVERLLAARAGVQQEKDVGWPHRLAHCTKWSSWTRGKGKEGDGESDSGGGNDDGDGGKGPYVLDTLTMKRHLAPQNMKLYLKH